MGIRKKGNFQYVVFDSFEKTGLVHHLFTTRLGGVSEGVFSELNLSYSRGEEKAHVSQNFKIVCDAMGSSPERAVLSKNQIHSTHVEAVEKKDMGRGYEGKNGFPDTDGFVTNVPGVLLVTFHADCVPLFFLDVKKRAIGLSHAGWRGTVNEMARATIEKMTECYGTDPKDLLAGIGPSIMKCCFQVDLPVVEEFQKKLPFAAAYISEDFSEEGKYKIDLQNINARIIEECGVKKENISISSLCTMCRQDLFFSHRAMGEKRGNMAAFLELIP